MRMRAPRRQPRIPPSQPASTLRGAVSHIGGRDDAGTAPRGLMRAARALLMAVRWPFPSGRLMRRAHPRVRLQPPKERGRHARAAHGLVTRAAPLPGRPRALCTLALLFSGMGVPLARRRVGAFGLSCGGATLFISLHIHIALGRAPHPAPSSRRMHAYGWLRRPPSPARAIRPRMQTANARMYTYRECITAHARAAGGPAPSLPCTCEGTAPAGVLHRQQHLWGMDAGNGARAEKRGGLFALEEMKPACCPPARRARGAPPRRRNPSARSDLI